MAKKSKKQTKKDEQTLYIGGEKVVVGPDAVTSTQTSASAEQVKKGLESIVKKDIFPIPILSG